MECAHSDPTVITWIIVISLAIVGGAINYLHQRNVDFSIKLLLTEILTSILSCLIAVFLLLSANMDGWNVYLVGSVSGYLSLRILTPISDLFEKVIIRQIKLRFNGSHKDKTVDRNNVERRTTNRRQREE